jgi:inner membrane protein
MASFAHVAVGMLAARLHVGVERPTAPRAAPQASKLRHYGAMIGFALLAMLPDADVLLVALGTDDSGVLGHRGASHSFLFAAVVGAMIGLAARRLGARGLRTAILCAVAIASHGLLDMVGEGGRGIPLLWPFSGERFLSPWRLLPDAPRGLKFLSWNGVVNVTVEFICFLPFTAYSLWPRAVRAPLANTASGIVPPCR